MISDNWSPSSWCQAISDRSRSRRCLTSGCLHGMSDDARDRYVAELGAVAAPQTRLFIVAFTPGGQVGVRGIEHAEIERRFTPQWVLVSGADETEMTNNPEHPARHYLLERR